MLFGYAELVLNFVFLWDPKYSPGKCVTTKIFVLPPYTGEDTWPVCLMFSVQWFQSLTDYIYLFYYLLKCKYGKYKMCSRNTVTLMLYPLFQILCRSPKTLWGYHFKGPVSRDFRTLLSKKVHLSRQKRFLCGHVSA